VCPPTDISDQGLETLIVESLVNEAGYAQGTNEDYEPEHVVDLAKLKEFLEATQQDAARAATEMLRNQGGGELTLKGRDGAIRSKDTIPPGNDPLPPRDKEH